MDNKELIKNAYEKGFFYEKTYRGCAQCSIAAVMDVLNIDNETIFKAASGLASGGGLTCEGTCGGYSGGVLVMGMLFGRRRKYFDDDEDYKRTSFRMARALKEKFFEKYNTMTCSEIHKQLFGRTYNLWDPEEKKQFSLDGSHETKCTSVVGLAASWTVEIVLDELESRGLKTCNVQDLL